MAAPALAEIPFLGSGVGFRVQVESGILANRSQIDFVEVNTDKFLFGQQSLDDLARLGERFPIIAHGVGLSVGSVAPPDAEYLAAIRRVSDVTRSPYYSEHLAVTRVPGFDLGHLSPVWLTEESLAVVIRNVQRAQDYLGKPVILENITHPFRIPNGDMSEPEFFSGLVKAAGCGILLDLTNLYINSVNHCFDPQEFLAGLPLDHVVQVHLAGGRWFDGVLMDTHSESVHEESWALLQAVCGMTAVKAILLEHDDNFPEFDVLLQQVRRARRIRAESPFARRSAVTPVGDGDPPAGEALAAWADVALSEDSVVVAGEGMRAADGRDGVVLVSGKTGLRYRLDDVGASVWRLLRMPIAARDIRDALLAEYDVEPTRCARDLLALLRQLADMGCIEIVARVPSARVSAEPHVGR